MDTIERSNRTWLCSVVFLDIVDYSKQSVMQQFNMKEYLNGFISHAIEHVPQNDLIILDTGDGAALCFMGDPEDALFVALSLRDAFGSQSRENLTHLSVRIGINLGPAKVIKDINGRLNIIGDGINVAQRVMNFAEPDQILVSRSFYEVVACLSQEYGRLFHYCGLRKDKHVREHAVYEVRLSGAEHPQAESKSDAACSPLVAAEALDMDRKTSNAGPVFAWDPEVLLTVQNQLALHMGPLARLLVIRAAKETADIGELYRRLADNIPDKHEKEVFLKHASLPLPAATQETPLPSPSAPLAPEAGTRVGRWDADTLKRLEVLLVQYIGPVGKVLVQREAKKASTLQELRHMLAEHLTVETERQAFLRHT